MLTSGCGKTSQVSLLIAGSCLIKQLETVGRNEDTLLCSQDRWHDLSVKITCIEVYNVTTVGFTRSKHWVMYEFHKKLWIYKVSSARVVKYQLHY